MNCKVNKQMVAQRCFQIAQEIHEDFAGNNNNISLTSEEQQIKEKAIADGTFMKAPNGKPTNLTEKQWLQVRTKAFKDWFGDWENNSANASKVVDENGEPLVVYHGTPEDNFTVFNLQKTEQILNETKLKEILDNYFLPLFDDIANKREIDRYDFLKMLEENKDFFDVYPDAIPDNPDYTFDKETKDLEYLYNTTKKVLLGYDIKFSELESTVKKISKEIEEKQKKYYLEEKTTNYNGIYFTSDEYYAKKMGDRRYKHGKPLKTIFSCFLNIKNPILAQEAINYENVDKIKENKQQNQDGIIGHDGIDFYASNGKEYVVFNSNQIKSATDNVGTFSSEDDDIRFYIEPNQLLKEGRIEEYVEMCRKAHIEDKDIVRILSNNKYFGKQFKEIYETDEIVETEPLSDARRQALETFKNIISDGIDFESFVKGLIARKDKSTFNKKDPYNTILKRNFPLFKSVKSGKTTFAATAEAVQQAYRDGNDESDNLGADLIAEFVNEYNTLTEINNAINGKKRKLKTSTEKLDYAISQLSSNLEEDMYLENLQKNATKQLIKHLRASGINVFGKADIEKYFKERPNSVVLNYYNLKQETPLERARHLLMGKYAKGVKQYNITTLEQLNERYDRFKSIFKNGKPLAERDWGPQVEEMGQAFPGVAFTTKNNRIVPIKPKKALYEENEKYNDIKEWVDSLSESEAISLAQLYAVEENEQFFMTPNGEIYGFVDKNGNIYLDETVITAEHPIHEYAHLWDTVIAKKNPQFWERGKELMKQTSLWDKIANDENYGAKWKSLNGITQQKLENLIASEVHARLVGRQGENIISKEQGNVIEKLKQWLLDFWKELKSAFSNWTESELQNLTLDDFVNMTLKDFVEGTDLNTQENITDPVANPENNSVQFSTNMEAAAFEETVNKTFPLPNKSVTERSENNTVLLKNLDDVALIYSLKNEAIAPIRAQSDMGLNKQSMRNITGNKQNTDLIANLKNILAQTNAKLFNYYNKYSNSEATSKVERQEIMRNYRILLAQQRRIEDILSQIDNFDNDKMIKSVDNMLDMFTEMFNILNEKQQYNGARGVITDPDILYLFRQINEAATMFFDAYGSMGEYMLNEIDDKELIEKINEQLNKWNGIKKAYRDTCDVIINNLEKEAEKYEKSENFKTGLQKKWQANLKRQIEKGLKDINALNGLFAFDNAFQENTVYPKIMSMIADKLDIETFNDDFWKLNEQFDVIVKKLRRKGIDLSDPKSYGRYFLERLSDGTETGRLVTCFTPKFRNDMRSFMARQVKSLTNVTDDDTMRQRSRLQDFIDNYNILDIMKLKEAYDENSELYRILQVLTTTVKHDENGETLLDENGNIVFSGKQWSQMVEDGEYTYDEDYEKKMKGLLGADYDRILAQYIKLMSESTLLATQRFDENGQPIFIMEDMMDEENPFFIMQYLNSIKSSKKSTNVLGKDKMYYNLNRMVYIPDSSRQEYFNMDFAHMCSESNPDREELLEAYNFFRMVFGDIAGTLYMNDAENTAYAKIPLDSYLDIMANTKDKRVKKQIGLLWSYMKSKFWDDKKEKKDMSKTNLNYSDMYNRTYWAVMESLKGTSYDQETREKMAYQIANDNTLYEHDFIKLTKNIMMLAAIQKRNNIMVEYMTLMRNRFAEIKTNMESTGNKEDAANQRTNALKAWDDQLSRGFKQQGIESNRRKKATATKGELIDIIRNASYEELDDAIDSIMKKQKLHIRSNDRAVINSLIKAIKAINDSTSLDSDFDFEYKGDTYSYRIKFSHGEMVKVFRKNGSPITNEKFVRARSEFLMEKIVDFGYECGLNSVLDEIMNLARLGALGGYVMTTVSGTKNRIDGLVADADMDARGFGFTPGNLAAAQRFMMGATLPMGLEGEGVHKFMQMFLTKKAYKRFMITKILGTRMKIFQDMTNLLDKNTGGSTMSAWKNNLNPYNMAVQFPEIRNQYDLFIARLLDYKIKDKDGKEHNFIENNEFVALDLDENGNIKLKDDFNPKKYDKDSKEYENTKRNIQWETFQTEIESDDATKRAVGEKDISDVVSLAIDHKNINKRANGDYRDMFKKLYSANWASRMLMQMKTYAPERFKAAWSKGENEDLLGEFYTAAAHGFFTNAALVSSAIRKGAHGGLKAGRVFPRPISRTIKGVTYGTAAIGMIIAAKHNNILKFETKRLKFDLMFLKALLYEEAMFLPRTVLKTKTNPIKFVFGKEGGIGSQLFNENIDAIVEQENLPEDKAKEYRKYVENMTEEQKRQHQGNLCALARTMARATYGHILRVFLSYVLFQIIDKIWGDDDDDEKNKELIKRRKQFVANNMKDITESTSTLYQMSFGLGDSYQNVMMVSKIDNIIKGLNQMQNLQYSSGTEKIIKNTAIIKSLMTHGFESTYKSNESDWEMAAYALDNKNLDKDNYYDKVFASRATKLKQQLTQAYMDAKTKQSFPPDELASISTAFEKYNNNRKKNKIDLPSEFNIYKIGNDEFKEFLNEKLPKFNGKDYDMYGNQHTGTNRDKVLEYQKWFKEHPYLEPSESGPIPDEMYIDEFSNNPTFEMDIIKMLKDYTSDGGEIINDDEKEKIDDIDARLNKLLR